MIPGSEFESSDAIQDAVADRPVNALPRQRLSDWILKRHTAGRASKTFLRRIE